MTLINNTSPFFDRKLTLRECLTGEKIYALDVETFYAKGYDMSNGLDAYINDPQFEITVLAFFNTSSGFSGDPKNAPVSDLNDALIFAHNAEFDQACVERAIELGQLPPFKPKQWICTMGMAKYCGLPGSLAKVAGLLLGQEISKEKRAEAKGWTKEECLADQGFVTYCRDDASTCYWIADALMSRYPAFEERVARLTREFSKYGIAYNKDNAGMAIEALEGELVRLQNKIPFEPSLSLKELHKWCAKNNISIPETTNAKDPRFFNWAQHEPEGTIVVSNMSMVRKLRKMISTLKSLDIRVRDDGRVSTPLKYWGAHTGRWSGSQGVNFQGLAKKELMGVNVMGFLVPEKDHCFVSFDFANIEPRILLAMAGQNDELEMIRNGMDIYEVHARSNNLYDGEEPLSRADPGLRQICKARVLGLGYGCGPATFKDVASSLTGGQLKLTEGESVDIVKNYRSQNKGIVKLWDDLEKIAKRSEGDRLIPLPSGRPLRFTVTNRDPLTVQYIKGEPEQRTWGSKLCENYIQAIARDVLADTLVTLHSMDLKVVLHVHDSVVLEVAKDEAKDVIKVVRDAVTKPPSWLSNLPLQIDIRKDANGL